MTGIDLRLAWKRAEMGLNSCQELAMRAAREVSAPQAITKQNIPPKKQAEIRAVITQTVGRVTRDVIELPIQTCDLQSGLILE